MSMRRQYHAKVRAAKEFASLLGKRCLDYAVYKESRTLFRYNNDVGTFVLAFHNLNYKEFLASNDFLRNSRFWALTDYGVTLLKADD